MNIMKRILCVFMCLILLAGTFSSFAFAENELTYSNIYYTEKGENYNADFMLDKLDGLLAENKDSLYIELKTKLPFVGETVILTIDLTSVDAICNTVDEYKGALTLAGPFMGDLNDLDFKTWKEGMSRKKTGDISLIKEFIELINANRELVEKICSGEADLGLLNSFIDIKSIFGEDGISGLIKGLIVESVYNKDEEKEKYNEAYNKAKTDLDSFIFGDLLYKFVTGEEGILPGFKMDASSTVEDIIIVGFGLVIDKYIAPALKSIDIDLTVYGEEFKALSEMLNLKGDSYDFSTVRFTEGTSLLLQINDVIGEIVKQLVPGYKNWTDGDYTLIESNLEGVFRFLAEGSGLIENAEKLTYEELVFEVISLILKKADFDKGIENCTTIEELFSKILINAANEADMGITYKGDESYGIILGDMLAFALSDYIKLTDLDSKEYKAGGGKDIWEVLNYAFNYLFFKKNLAGYIGLAVEEQDSIFTKIDRLVDYFGENKQVSFDSKKFFVGKGEEKGLIQSVFTLDLGNILEITAVKALNAAGDVSVLEFIYKTLMYMLNNWSESEMVPAFTNTKPLNNLFTNSGISFIIKEIIRTVEERKDYAVPLLAFIMSFVLKSEPYDSAEILINGIDDITVNYDGKTLSEGRDYNYITKDENGLKTLSFTFKNNYMGQVEAVISERVKSVEAKVDGNVIDLSWDEVKGTAEYEIYYGKDGSEFEKIASVTENKYTVKSSPSSRNVFKIRAVYKNAVVTSYGEYSEEFSIFIPPEKVTSLKVTEKTSNSVSLSWKKVNAADKYDVFIYKNGKWVKTAETTVLTATVSGLSANTSYKFKVRAYDNNTSLYGEDSDTVTARTNLSAVKGIKANAVAATSVTLTWNKVKGADSYTVYQYKNGSWKSVGKTSKTSLAVKSLKSNKKYSFRVKAYSSKTKVYSDSSSTFNAVTIPVTVKKLKASSVKATSVKLTWDKVSGATGYQIYRSTNGKKWTKIGTVSSKYNYFTDKKANKNTKYYYKVRSYRKASGKTYYADYSKYIKVNTKKK